MPQRKSGLDELKKSEKRHLHNLDIKTGVKKAIKGYIKSVENKNIDEAKENLKTAYKKIDKAAKANVLNKNTASRRKSVLSKQLKKIV